VQESWGAPSRTPTRQSFYIQDAEVQPRRDDLWLGSLGISLPRNCDSVSGLWFSRIPCAGARNSHVQERPSGAFDSRYLAIPEGSYYECESSAQGLLEHAGRQAPLSCPAGGPGPFATRSHGRFSVATPSHSLSGVFFFAG
jgi:hypothetical protein